VSILKSQTKGANSRWYVLILAAFTLTFTVAMQQICMTVLFKEISESLGLSLVQIGFVWGMPAFSGLLIVFFGGLLSDRYGAKHVISIACILGGIAGALRGIAGDFPTLLLFTFLMGLALWVIPASVFKSNAAWFSGRPLVIANGVASAGMGLGFTVGSLISATILSPLLGGWQNVLFLYGGISIVIGLFWLFTVKEFAGSAAPVSGVPLRQSVSRVFPIRSLWFIGLTLLGFSGCIQGMVGYLPTYLRDIGWTVPAADGALAVFTGISTLGVVPLAILSDRIGLRKALLFPILVITTALVALLPLVTSSAMVFVIMILVGVSRDAFMAICLTMSTETKGVGVVYAATAMGLAQTVMNVGSLVAPPLGNSLANPANPASPYPFFLWAGFGLLALVSFFFVKETGWKHKELEPVELSSVP
jgi:MFS family permease